MLSFSCSSKKEHESIVDPLPNKKLVKIETYTLDPVKGGYGTVFPSQIFYQLSMLGKKSKRLISRIGNLNYEYTLDDDGYVKTIKQRSVNSPHTIDYTLFYDK